MSKKEEFKKVQSSKSGEAYSSYTNAEAMNLLKYLNYIFSDQLKETTVLKKFHIIPIDETKPENLFHAFKNGIMFNYLINIAKPGTIDEFSINTQEKMLIYHIAQNLQLAIHSARSIGCKVVGINPTLLMNEKSETLILGMTWQVVRIISLNKCSIRENPLLATILTGKETNDELAKLTNESLLLKWINFHLSKTQYKKEVKNIIDLSDGVGILYLQAQIDKACNISTVNSTDKKEKFETILKNSFDIFKIPRVFDADMFMFNNVDSIRLLICLLFEANPGLVQPTVEVKAEATVKLITLLDGQLESNEERSYREWINSLFPDGEVYIEPDRLLDSLKDGLILIKVLSKIDPNLIDGKYIKDPGANRLKMGNNCTYALNQIKKIPGIVIVGISGLDILDGKKDLICGFLWQLVANHYMKMLGNLKEADIISWANKKVVKEPFIKDFQDKTMKDGKFLLRIIDSIQKDVVSWEHVKNGTTLAEYKDNTKYLLSCARKINAPIYMNVDDIITLNPKIITILLATLMLVENSLKQ